LNHGKEVHDEIRQRHFQVDVPEQPGRGQPRRGQQRRHAVRQQSLQQPAQQQAQRAQQCVRWRPRQQRAQQQAGRKALVEPRQPLAARVTRLLLLFASHAVAIGIGFALGIYALPILTAPAAPTAAEAAAAAGQATYRGRFRRDLKDSDLLHWGEGTISVAPRSIVLAGQLAPGPDYKLYLSPEFVETEADFMRLKPRMARVGDVRTFQNFVVPVPAAIDVSAYTTAIVWCESFSQFITAAKYR
jgi:hypothetical protein